MSKVRAIPPDTKESPLSPPLPPPIDVAEEEDEDDGPGVRGMGEEMEATEEDIDDIEGEEAGRDEEEDTPDVPEDGSLSLVCRRSTWVASLFWAAHVNEITWSPSTWTERMPMERSTFEPC